MPSSPSTIPDGFKLFSLRDSGTFFESAGPLYERIDSNNLLQFGVQIEHKHCNFLGIPHGGMLVTLADSAMGINLSRYLNEKNGTSGQGAVTISINSEFLSAAKIGDWLETDVVFRKIGRNLSFIDCTLRVGTKEILFCSAIFSTIMR